MLSSPAHLPQVLFINTILKLLWPHLSPAIHKMAMEQAKVPLEDVCKKVRLSAPVGVWARRCNWSLHPFQPAAASAACLVVHAQDCCCSSSLLETQAARFIASQAWAPTWPHVCMAPMHCPRRPVPALADVQAKVLKTIRIDKLDLGTVPPRVDCFKSFETGEDELIIEASSCLLAVPCLLPRPGELSLPFFPSSATCGAVCTAFQGKHAAAGAGVLLASSTHDLERQVFAKEMGAF